MPFACMKLSPVRAAASTNHASRSDVSLARSLAGASRGLQLFSKSRHTTPASPTAERMEPYHVRSAAEQQGDLFFMIQKNLVVGCCGAVVLAATLSAQTPA